MTMGLTQHSAAPPPSVAAYRQSIELAHCPAGQMGYCSMRMAQDMAAARRVWRVVSALSWPAESVKPNLPAQIVYPPAHQPAGTGAHVGQ